MTFRWPWQKSALVERVDELERYYRRWVLSGTEEIDKRLARIETELRHLRDYLGVEPYREHKEGVRKRRRVK